MADVDLTAPQLFSSPQGFIQLQELTADCCQIKARHYISSLVQGQLNNDFLSGGQTSALLPSHSVLSALAHLPNLLS